MQRFEEFLFKMREELHVLTLFNEMWSQKNNSFKNGLPQRYANLHMNNRVKYTKCFGKIYDLEKCGLNGPGGMFYLYLLFMVTVAMLNGWQGPLDIILKADMIQANFKLTPCCRGRCQKYENLGTDGK